MPELTDLREGTGFYSIAKETFDDISADLAAHGYEVPSQPQDYYGGGGYVKCGRLIVGGEGSGGGGFHRGAEHETDYGSGLGFFTLGWLGSLGKMRIYPLIGFGGTGTGASVRSSTDETKQLMPSADKKSTIFQIGTFSPAFSLSMGFELRIFLIVIGIRVGYVFLPLAEQHKGKPFVRLLIGGRYRIKKN